MCRRYTDCWRLYYGIYGRTKGAGRDLEGDKLGVQPGWVALQQLVHDHVEIYFIPPEHNRSLAGVLAKYTDVRIPTEEALREARERARTDRSVEVVAGISGNQLDE